MCLYHNIYIQRCPRVCYVNLLPYVSTYHSHQLATTTAKTPTPVSIYLLRPLSVLTPILRFSDRGIAVYGSRDIMGINIIIYLYISICVAR